MLGALLVFAIFAFFCFLGYMISRVTPGVSAGLRVGGVEISSGQPAAGNAPSLADKHLLIVAVVVAITGLALMLWGVFSILGYDDGTGVGVGLLVVGLLVALSGIGLIIAGPKAKRAARICGLGVGVVLAAVFPIGTALGIYISWTLALRKEAGTYF